MRIALVTGGSSGIGRAAALGLAGRGFHVVVAGRSRSRVEAVVEEIEGSDGSAEPLIFDLASLESVRRSAEGLLDSGRRIDVLVNNAGVGAGRGQTVDGFEIHFGVNHLGHFALTETLRPVLGDGSRVIQVSSEVHRRARGIELERVRGPTRSLFGLSEYAASKLANILHASELGRRRPGWAVASVHPGLTNTPILPLPVRIVARRRLHSPEQAAARILWCVDAPIVGESPGLYYADDRPVEPSPYALDHTLATTLWDLSEEWCAR